MPFRERSFWNGHLPQRFAGVICPEGAVSTGRTPTPNRDYAQTRRLRQQTRQTLEAHGVLLTVLKSTRAAAMWLQSRTLCVGIIPAMGFARPETSRKTADAI